MGGVPYICYLCDHGNKCNRIVGYQTFVDNTEQAGEKVDELNEKIKSIIPISFGISQFSGSGKEITIYNYICEFCYDQYYDLWKVAAPAGYTFINERSHGSYYTHL